MIRPDQIPDEVVEAVMYCFHTRSSARAAIAAALSAWPGAEQTWMWDYNECIALPLPQKENNSD